ncbi:MAG: hypothetical protein KA212_04045 [Burkholderiaceae bacterium]|nr:hypothetical protein [Burkholderiaceae bacterium]
MPPELAGALASILGNDGGNNGLGGLVDKFNQAGHGDIISSWIDKGENKPVSENQLQDVLGNLSGPLLAMLPALLPMIIDKLTPDGQAPQGGLGNSGDLLGSLMKSMSQGQSSQGGGGGDLLASLIKGMSYKG